MLGLLAPLASLLGFEASEITDKLKQNALLWAVIGLFALVALVFLLVTANTAMTAWLGPIWGPLAMAGAAAVIAGATYGISRITATIEHRREAERRRSAETTALVTTATLTALPMLLRSPLMKSIGLPLGGALAAMFLLSKSGPASRPKGDGS